MLEKYQHKTVLLRETIKELNLKPNGIYIDATFGRGGHSKLILSYLKERGKLIAIDRDPEAIKEAKNIKDSRFTIIHGLFSNILKYVNKLDLLGKINGVILDLGVSSPQLDNPIRGFSFMKNGPLDMRMDNTCGQTAAEWLSKASKKEIIWVLKNFGEENYAKSIAQAIFERKKIKKITSTHELANLIANCKISSIKSKHPATLSFQAIRIYINKELEEIKCALQAIPLILTPGGKLLIISFHSLEGRIIKNFIKNHTFSKYIKNKVIQNQIENKNIYKFKCLLKLNPSKQEIVNNPRARSSILRVIEKLL